MIDQLTGQSFRRVLFTNSGSENTELALKIADYISKKGSHNRILAFKDSYHGTFFGFQSQFSIFRTRIRKQNSSKTLTRQLQNLLLC